MLSSIKFISTLCSRKLLLAVCAAAIVVAGGCSSSDPGNQPSAEELFQKAKQLFEEEDYLEAYNEFRVMSLQYQGSALADDAQFYMGECQFRREEYLLAAFEYESLVRTMPTSELVPNAQFQLAMCYYSRSPDYYRDQEYTVKAIDAFQAFLEYHPTDPRVPEAEAKINELNAKLARKEYESGIIYMKMEYYRAATVSFDYVLEKYHDTPYAEPALLKKAQALYARRRYRDARDIARRFLEKYPSSSFRETAESLLKNAQDGIEEESKAPKSTTDNRGNGAL